MSYGIKFYCRRGDDASVIAEELKVALLVHYPGLGFQQYPPQPDRCELEVEAPTGA
jgi:hypothetical protein